MPRRKKTRPAPAFAREVSRIVAKIPVSKTHFAALLGVTWPTLMRWERTGVTYMTQIQREILACLGRLAKARAVDRERFVKHLEQHGLLRAVVCAAEACP